MATGTLRDRALLSRVLRWRMFSSRPSRSTVLGQNCELTHSFGEEGNGPAIVRDCGGSLRASIIGSRLCRDSVFARQVHSTPASLVAPDFQVERSGDVALLHVLQCEIEDLTKQSRNITARNPPKSFTLVKDEPGELEMTLQRVYGLEDIEVFCALQLVPKKYRRKAEVGEDPQARTRMLQLTITVTKGYASPALKVRCECYRDCFAIHQVDLEAEGDGTVYQPYFSQLRSRLVNNFQIFLYDRGLNADLALYMERHLENKRLMKSVGIVENIRRFMS